MAKNQKDLSESLLADDSPGWLTGFLADEDEFDRRALWRLASWGVGSVGAVIIAILALQTGTEFRHEEIAAADLARQSQTLQSIAKTNEREARRLASAIDTLNGDRDRLFTRMTAVEQGLDSVTGSINRKNVTQSDPPKTSSPKEAALSSPQALPAPSPPDKTPPSQASALPAAPSPELSAATVNAAALPAIQPDAKKFDAKAGTAKTDLSKADLIKTDLIKTDVTKTDSPTANSSKPELPKTAEASAISPPSPPVAPVDSIAPAAAAETVVAKTTTSKPSAVKLPPADTAFAKPSSVKTQAPNSASAASQASTDLSAGAPLPLAPQAAPKPAAVAQDLSTTKPSEPIEVASAKSQPETDRDVQQGRDAKIVVASIPPVAAAEPGTPASVPAAHTDFGVDLGSASSIKGLRALWRGVMKSDAKELASLRPIIALKERTNGLGMQLRLVAGPLVDAAAAAKICAVLSENGRTCETAVFDGQRLAMKEDTKANDLAVTAKKPRSHTRHRHNRRAARIEEPAPPPPAPPPPPKPSTFSSFFSR